MFTLHDYSERGLVNALFDFVISAEHPDALWADLIKRSLLWYSALMEPTARSTDSRLPIQTLSVYVEPSLSMFGTPDAVVLVDYKTGPNESHPGDVFFIEAKLETFASSSKGTDFKSNCSSVLHELFLKARFHELAQRPSATESVRTHSLLTPGVLIYQNDTKSRKIGKDPQVVELAQAIAKRSAYFVSLTTDETPPVGALWPMELQEVPRMLQEIHSVNEHAQSVDPHVSYGNPLGGWIETSLHLGWDQVWLWAEVHGLSRVTRAIEENRMKFKCRPIELPQQIRDFFDIICNCELFESTPEDPTKVSPKWIVRSRLEGKVGSFDVVNGPDAQLWIVMYFSKQGPGLLTMEHVAQLTKEGSADRDRLYELATRTRP